MDFTLFHLINGLAGQWQAADEFFRFFANDYVVPTTLIAFLVMGWFTGQERWRQVVLHALLALLVANGMVKLSNLIWFRPRPFTFNEVNLLFYYPSDSSFPSNSAAVVWCIAWAIWQGRRRGDVREGAPDWRWMIREGGGERGGAREDETSLPKPCSEARGNVLSPSDEVLGGIEGGRGEVREEASVFAPSPPRPLIIQRQSGTPSPPRLFALFLAALMGFSRVWVGVHYPFDIVGGAAVGILAVSLVERYHIELRPLRKWCVWLAQNLGLA